MTASAGQSDGRGSARIARPTMKDVAALAGVGVKTVSRVVNGERYVSEETRLAVEQAIRQLRFQRNASAANLRQGQTATVGLIVEDISEPIQSRIARAVEGIARTEGTLLFTASSAGDPRRERELIESFVARRVDGLIIAPSPTDHGFLRAELDAGLPLVFVDRPADGLVADAVVSENRAGAAEGVRHLTAQGHQRIAYIGNAETVYTGRERLAGYRDALAAAGIPFDDALVSLGDPDPGHSEAALRRMVSLAHPATALFTGNSLHTIATLRAPTFAATELAFVAFDDVELLDLIARPVTVVAQDLTLIGRTAAQRLFTRLRGLDDAPTTITLPTRLIPR